MLNCNVPKLQSHTTLISFSFFAHRQILFKAEMIHHAAEFIINIRWEQWLKKAAHSLCLISLHVIDWTVFTIFISYISALSANCVRFLSSPPHAVDLCQHSATNILHLTHFTLKPWSPSMFVWSLFAATVMIWYYCLKYERLVMFVFKPQYYFH